MTNPTPDALERERFWAHYPNYKRGTDDDGVLTNPVVRHAMEAWLARASLPAPESASPVASRSEKMRAAGYTAKTFAIRVR